MATEPAPTRLVRAEGGSMRPRRQRGRLQAVRRPVDHLDRYTSRPVGASTTSPALDSTPAKHRVHSGAVRGGTRARVHANGTHGVDRGRRAAIGRQVVDELTMVP